MQAQNIHACYWPLTVVFVWLSCAFILAFSPLLDSGQYRGIKENKEKVPGWDQTRNDVVTRMNQNAPNSQYFDAKLKISSSQRCFLFFLTTLQWLNIRKLKSVSVIMLEMFINISPQTEGAGHVWRH